MKLLLIGCGYWGKNWAKTLSQLNYLGGICEANTEQHATLAQQYPDVPLYSNLSEALESTDIQGAVIATPVPTHFSVAKACLEKRLPILIEKPLTATLPEAQELVRLSEASKTLVAVGHLLMYHPALTELKKRIEAGELGEILSVQCTRSKMGKIRNEETVWMSFAPHDVSILTYLLDSPLKLTNCQASYLLDRPHLPDAVHAQFLTDKGQSASISVDWLYPIKTMQTIVTGTRQIAILDDTAPPERKLQLIPYELDRQSNQVNDLKTEGGTFVTYHHEEPLALEAKAFSNAIQHQTTLVNNAENGLAVMTLLDSVEQTLQKTPALI